MRLLNEQDLKARGIRFCRQHRHRMVKAGEFPAPVKIGANSNAWLESEIDAWLTERVRKRDAARTEAA